MNSASNPSRYSARMPSASICNGERQRSVENAEQALPAVHARLVVVLGRLAARDSHRVLLRLDLQIVLIDTRQFDHGDEIVLLLEDVDGRITAGAGGARAHPIALPPRFERALQRRYRGERIVKTGKHRSSSFRNGAELVEARLVAGLAGRSPGKSSPSTRRGLDGGLRASRSSAHKASNISSTVTVRPLSGARRSAGAASTAQASDAQDDRIARFSASVRSRSSTTSCGCAKSPAGCIRSSIAGSNGVDVLILPQCFIAISSMSNMDPKSGAELRRSRRQGLCATRRNRFWSGKTVFKANGLRTRVLVGKDPHPALRAPFLPPTGERFRPTPPVRGGRAPPAPSSRPRRR